MENELEYYNKFPDILRDALINKKVKFPESLQCKYNNKNVYRAVKYNSKKTIIDKTDFLSQMERKQENPLVPADETDISSYSCSCFLNLDELHMYTKFPYKNKAIAKGIIKEEFGPIDINQDTSHVDLYLFDMIDPSDYFEVIEKWEKNG